MDKIINDLKEIIQQLKSDGYDSIVFVEVIIDLREIERMRDKEE